MRPRELLLLLAVQRLLAAALPHVSSYEFTAYRMQQFNLLQEKHGCRGAAVAAEARSAADPVLTRRCVIMKLLDFSRDRILEAQRQSAAAVLLLLPSNASGEPREVLQSFMLGENQVLLRETPMPVYVAPEDQQLLCMYDEVQQAAASRTSWVLVRVLRSMVSATSFQILVGSAPIQAVTDLVIAALEGVLPGAGADAPTVVVTAHYDSYGLAPWLSYGADSNASGVVVLLELARLFQRLYSSSRPPFHLMFSLTGGGKYNFLGTKRWLEAHLDHAESSLLQDNVALVLCLDTLANGDALLAHVSRPPRPGGAAHAFIRQLEEVASSRFPWVKVGVVHKKINLLESSVSWEHERYGRRRLPGLTVSHVEAPSSSPRGSMLDTMSQVDFRKMKRNGVMVAEALARYLFNVSDQVSPKDVQVFKGPLDFHDGRMSSLMSSLTSLPRAAQLDREPDHALLVNSLEHEFKRHLQQVHRHAYRQDRKDPDITFFDHMKQPMVMHRVKPAAFDLFLGGCIAAYLGIVYLSIQNFGCLYSKIKAAAKSKHE